MFGKQIQINHAFPLILAHRGARKYAPENTIAAFKKAKELGFDGVELDVVLTYDKTPVVFHGTDLSLTTKSHGLIHKMLYKDVLNQDAGELFDPRFKGEKIPTLAEALEYLANTNMFINIELKPRLGDGDWIARTVVEEINYFCLYERVLVSSFSPFILRHVSKLSPRIPTALLLGPNPLLFLKFALGANLLKLSHIGPVFSYTSKGLVELAHKNGIKVLVWTINTRQELAKCVEIGVDMVVTDEPELIMEKETRWKEWAKKTANS